MPEKSSGHKTVKAQKQVTTPALKEYKILVDETAELDHHKYLTIIYKKDKLLD